MECWTIIKEFTFTIRCVLSIVQKLFPITVSHQMVQGNRSCPYHLAEEAEAKGGQAPSPTLYR